MKIFFYASFTFLILLLSLSQIVWAAVSVTTATGGSSISADTTGGSYTTLTGPTITEGATGDFPASGTLVLTAPTGFIFNTGATVNATITRIAGSRNCFTFTSTTATPTSTTITFTMASADQNGGNPSTRCEVAFSNIQVRPDTGTVASGDITHSGTASVTGLTGSTNLGTLTIVAGAKSQVGITTQPSSTANVDTDFATKPIVAIQDQYGNTLTSDNSSTITRTVVLSSQSCGGTAGSGTLTSTPASGATVASGLMTYTAMEYSALENIKICFSSSGATSVLSNSIDVNDDPLPTKIDDAGDPGAMAGAGRQVVRTSSGTLYAFINDGGSCEIWKSADGSSWSEQDNANNPACSATSHVTVAIDSNDNLHTIYLNGSSQVDYVTFSTSTDTFGTPENVFASTGSYFDIAVDSNNIPHTISYFSTLSSSRYANRVGGTWSTVSISTAAAVGHSIVINEDDIPEISYISTTSNLLGAGVGNQNNATSFTIQTVDATVNITGGSAGSSIAVDSSGNTWIAYVDATGTNQITLVEHLDGDAWTTWQTPVTNSNVGNEPSIVIKGTDIYVFYEDSSDDDIKYDMYDGATWLGEQTLATGTFQDVKAKWSFLNDNYGNTQIDFLYSDGTDIYWHALFFPLPTVTTQAASSITSTTATSNGNITDTGGENNDLRGFVYDISTKSLPGNVAPTSSGYASYVESSGSYGTGAFTNSLSGLTAGQTYYGRAYSHNSAGYSYGNEISFTTPLISITITSDGIISYGTLPANTSQNTTAGGINDTQTAENDGNITLDFNIRGQDSPNWVLGATTALNQYTHEYSTNSGGNWTFLTTSYQTLATGITASGNQAFDLRITTPSSSTNYSQQSVDITVQAVEN